MAAEPAIHNVRYDGLAQLHKEKERLDALLQNVKDKIAKIKSEYPYIMKALVQSPKKTEARRAELEAYIKQLNESLAAYTAKIEEMVKI
jgi:chromosome segregation ATPase